MDDQLLNTTVKVMFLGTNPTAAPYNAVFVDDDIAQLTMDFTFANPGIWRLEIRRFKRGLRLVRHARLRGF